MIFQIFFTLTTLEALNYHALAATSAILLLFLPRPGTNFLPARILHQNYRGPDLEMEAFEEQKLADWKRITEHTK